MGSSDLPGAAAAHSPGSSLAEFERHPAFRFRLEDLSAEQLRAVARAVRERDLGEVPERERLWLECLLGVFVDRASRGAGPAALSPRVLRRMLLRPEKVFRHLSRHVYVARMVFRARLLAMGEPDPGAEAAREVAIEPLAPGSGRSAPAPVWEMPVEAPAAAPAHDARRPGDAPAPAVGPVVEVAPEREPALRFRLAELGERERRAVARWLARSGTSELDPSEVVELEAWLGVLVDRYTRGHGLDGVSPRLLGTLLARPHALLRGIGHARYVAGLVAQERRRRIEAGEETSPRPFRASRFDAALAPALWWTRVRRDAARFARRWVGNAPTRLARSPGVARARSLAKRIETELAAGHRWLTLLAFAIATQGARFVSSQFFGRPANGAWYETGAPLFASWAIDGDVATRVGVALSTCVLAGVSWKRFGEPWVRKLVAVVVGGLLVSALSIAPNPYFRSAFFADRALLVALGVGSFFHPVAVPGFLAGYRLLHQQLRFPELTPYPYLHYRFLQLPLELLLGAFVVFAILWLAMRAWRPLSNHVFLLLSTSVLAGFYVDWARVLARMGPRPWTWFAHESLGDALVSSWLAGWFPGRGEDGVLSAARVLDVLSPALLAAFALAIAAGVGALFHRRLAVGAFLVLLVLHVGYLGVTGILLWGASLACAGVVWLLLSERDALERAFGVGPGLVFAAVTLLLPRPDTDPDLARWHTPMTTTLRIELVAADGARHPLDASWIAPYDRLLTLQLGVVQSAAFEHRGTTSSFDTWQDARAGVGRWGTPNGRDPDARSRLEGRIPQVQTLEAFDELLRRALEERSGTWRSRWRRFAPSAVHPIGPRQAEPPVRLREAVFYRATTLRTRTGLEPLVDEVVHRVDLSVPP